MVDNAPWFLFTHRRGEMQNGIAATNESMVEELAQAGALKTAESTAAFQAIDRAHFWPQEGASVAYADMPLRSGKLHLSAPHIYAKALESLLPLKKGMSFLNIGSGTGYFNSLVGEMIGDEATNHGVDIWPETIAHARQRCQQIGKTRIEFTLGNVYQLNVHETMRYDRIYLGACANPRSKYLYRLLEVGGVLIGPFQAGHSQQLRRVVRHSETQFHVEVLGSVQFACLVEPVATTPPAPSDSEGRSGTTTPTFATEDNLQPVGLSGIPFTFSLVEKPWCPTRSWLYPASFKEVVLLGIIGRSKDPTKPWLPPEIWVKHVVPWCSRRWFEAPSGSPTLSTAASPRCVASSAMDEVPPMALPQAACTEQAEESDEKSDEERSTQSTSMGSPSNRPTVSPDDMPLDSAEPGPDSDPIEDSGTLFEVFGNGQRHAIGANGDPDEIDPNEGPRFVVPLRVLQLIAQEARSRRRRRAYEDEDEEVPLQGQDEEEEDDDADSIEGLLALPMGETQSEEIDADPVEWASAQDQEMVDADQVINNAGEEPNAGNSADVPML